MAGLRERQKATRTQRILDEAFELFPAKRFRRFHEDAIGRGLADVLAEAEFDGVQPSSRASASYGGSSARLAA